MSFARSDNLKQLVRRRPTLWTLLAPLPVLAPLVLPLMLAVLLGSCNTAQAASALVRQERLVHRFDFESTDDQGRKLGEGHTWPKHWYGIGRPPQTADPHFQRQPLHQQLIAKRGFPRYSDIGYDRRHATSGDFSLAIGLNGGNAGTYLEVGTIPAIPGSDYLITANVRTENLKHARGRLTAYFVDGHGRRIDATVQHTQPIRTAGKWTTIAVKLTGEVEDAAWIGLELAVLQPTPDRNDPLGSQQIVLKDVKGTAWFDDISIWQMPHVELRTESAVNIIHAPQRPRLEARVRDTLRPSPHRPVARL